MRWYEAGRDGRRRSRTFTRKADARLFEAELMRRKALGEFAFIEASNKRLEDLASQWWEIYAKPNLAYNTLAGYAPALDKHALPRLGRLKLRDVTPEVLARFRADLEKAGVGRSSVRISLVVVQAMFSRAQEWGWVSSNPARGTQALRRARARGGLPRARPRGEHPGCHDRSGAPLRGADGLARSLRPCASPRKCSRSSGATSVNARC